MSRNRDEGVNRRTFIGRAAAAAGVLVVPPVVLAQTTRMGAPTGATSTSPADWRRVARELEEVTLSQLSEGLSAGRWTSQSLVRSYLARIAAMDRAGPELHALIEVNPDALEIAASLDAERAASGPRSALHGIPIVVKDSIGTADRMHTSAGSRALAEFTPLEDAAVVEKLRRAGCIVLGKTNMSEWSNARGRFSIAGWSGRGNLTLNPYALDRSPGGSSSGSAAAVAANLAPAAIGVETLGSIVSPASMCGIVGVKPTVGLVSRRGIIPVTKTQDTAGPMCRTVRDAAMLLSAMAGQDAGDPVTRTRENRNGVDYTRFLDANGLRGARIGVARNLFGFSNGADRVAEEALAMLKAGGATVVDPANIESADGILPFDMEVVAYELKASLEEYFQTAGANAPVRTLDDIIEFNERHRDHELRWFGQEVLLYAREKGPLTSPDYQQALSLVRRFSREQGIDATIAQHRLDAIVAPTQAPAWLIDMLAGDNSYAGGFVPSAAAGYPSISVPAGNVAGLPVGLLFMGGAWSEARLFRLAYAFEQIARARRAPQFEETIAL